MINLRPNYQREANRVMRRAFVRLRRGRGVGGQRLRPKARPDGKPLGGNTVARDLLRGRVTADQNGFRIDYSHLENVTGFDEGAPARGQPARPVVGLVRRERREIFLRARAEAVRQLNKELS